MKPNFALDLSHDGIGLVHRGKGGWVLVGEVSLEHPDLSSGLDLLRRKAADLESGGFSCKLIIPSSQLLYTTLTAPGPDNTTREARIREGLEGLTPYDVEDLVFDWRADPDEDGMVHVAVVARETLDEAEAFANEHNLNPLCFVARPSGSFLGEAFFGPVKSGFVTAGVIIEPDQAPVPELLGTISDKNQAVSTAREESARSQTSTSKKADKDQTGETALPELAPFPPTPDAPATKAPAPSKSADASSDHVPKPVPDAATVAKAGTETATSDKAEVETPADMPSATKPQASSMVEEDKSDRDGTLDSGGTKVSGIVPPPPPPTIPEAEKALRPEPDAPTFSSRRIEDPTPNQQATDPVEIEVKPRLSFGVDRGAPDGKAPPTPTPSEPPEPPVQKPVHVPVTAPVVFGDDSALDPPRFRPKELARSAGDKSTEKLSSAARKGAAGLASAADAAGKLGRKAALKIEDRRRERIDRPQNTRPKVALPKLRKRDSETGTAPTDTAIAPPPSKTGDKGRPARTAKPPRVASPRAREAETMTVFGARQTQSVGGKPKYLGLFLVLGLLLLMAVVAVWSMFFLNDTTSWLFPEREDPFEAAISADPDTFTQESEEDDANVALENDEDQARSVTGARDPLTPEAAQARYAATGIWQRAPEPMTSPETTDLDDLYVASIDPETAVQDAVALPAIDLPTGETAQINTAPPPPLGTTFALDSDGLVIATPEGALSPDGVMVFAGKPALVPAPRPGSDAVVPTVEETVDATPAQPRIRPRARPEGLIEGNERLQLGGRTRTELAVLRPRARPTTPRAAEQAAAIVAALDADLEENAAAGNPSTAAVVAPTEQAITTSREPRHRPSGFNKIVARSNAARSDASDGSVAVAAASPQQSVTPSIPTRTSVAKQATIKNAINLRKISLIGIYGSASSRRALVRLPSGRYQKVGVGSRLDGGKVVSISSTALIYKKGSRSVTLEVLPFS
ncbi:hypothetical protein [Aliiroseovarius sp. F47248L]|uniref:hypothetical protein n=1 Tax=Aliiroseovarius sp. F47248L TaxID=2926420 RepID=UPI001FF2A9F8|nr:hypothetical protein [Aliiroseovarius sp. F47248L]MCK0138614.1 hypothetical protein [Aliiroseovarius sp. F47248L]